MSYSTWINYGYGISIDKIYENTNLKKLKQLLEYAPTYKNELIKTAKEITKKSEKNLTIEDFCETAKELDLYVANGLAIIIANVIEEKENIRLTYCDNFEEETYLILQPWYPWNKMTKEEKALTSETKINTIFNKYIHILTKQDIEIDYQSVENGG